MGLPEDVTEAPAPGMGELTLGLTLTLGDDMRIRRRDANIQLGGTLHLERTQRNFFAASSCGICGKTSIDQVRLRGIPPPNPYLRLDPEVCVQLPADLPVKEVVVVEDNDVGRPGGLHHQLVRAALAADLPEFLRRHRIRDHPLGPGPQLGRGHNADAHGLGRQQLFARDVVRAEEPVLPVHPADLLDDERVL